MQPIIYGLILLLWANALDAMVGNNALTEIQQNQEQEEWPEYGAYIVQIGFGDQERVAEAAQLMNVNYDVSVRHELKVNKLSTSKDTNGLNFLVIEGVNVQDLENIPGVIAVTPDAPVYAAEYSWGIDRSDQLDLPLDTAEYSPDFEGCGVDVYVLDTGLDATHSEFSDTGNGREVENIFNGYEDISSNTDVNGHGSHCAGTVGGKTVGIAKCANIYGVKVLSDAGSGSTSTILAGMDAALSRHQAKGTAAKSVVSMSLGGSCGTSCSTNAMILKVQEMTAAGMIVSVAAGNSAADSGAYTPAAAPDALTVGASSIRDSMASFSNYGTLIDIMGPGVDITSVCSSRATCSGLWWTISGTSMACPHVSGVAAQLLEKGAHVEMTSLAAMNEVRTSMLDDSSKGKITGTPGDTKNDLLQVPKDDGIWNGEPMETVAPTTAPTGPSFAPTTLPTAAPTERASVLVLMDDRVVDTTREGPNTITDTEAAVGEVDTITTYTTGSIASGLLNGITRFVIPELEKGSFLSLLSTADRTALKSYVESGAGRLIVMGGIDGDALIDGIFGLSLVSSFSCSSTSTKTGDAADTIFKDDAATLAYANAVYCLTSASLPATATSVYVSGSDSAVTTFYGDNLVHLGYDWYFGTGTAWADILATALLSGTAPSVAPTVVPTDPTLIPTAVPTTAVPTTAVPTAAPSVTPSFAPTYESCPAGEYPPSQCMVCGPGSFSAEGGLECTVCPEGTFAPTSGASECSTCPDGYYSLVGASTCLKCEPGTKGESPPSGTCTACEPGTWSHWGSVSCSMCPEGWMSFSGSSTCSKCEPGTKGESPPSGTCTACEAGTWSHWGSVSCSKCSEGWISMSGSSTCFMCPVGTKPTDDGTSCESVAPPAPASVAPSASPTSGTVPSASPSIACAGPFDGYSQCATKINYVMESRPDSWLEKRGIERERCAIQAYYAQAVEGGPFCPPL